MKKILVALDNSERAPQVLKAAVDHAQSTGAKLHLLRAIPWPMDLPTHAYPLTPADFEQVSLRISLEELESLTKDVPAGLIADKVIRFGTPWKEICDLAVELDVDLVVLGAHGYSFIERILGTTASRVSNRIDRSILLVRSPERLASS